MKKNLTACFTGHRPKGLPWGYDETQKNCILFKTDLKNILRKAIDYGITTFLTGMAEGFDMIAGETIAELKIEYPYIKLIAVIPCENQEIKWSRQQQLRYKNLLIKCDNQIVLNKYYTPTCMNERNKYMVMHASICIACYDGKPSGTENTLRFAKENGLKVRLINPNDYKE